MDNEEKVQLGDEEMPDDSDADTENVATPSTQKKTRKRKKMSSTASQRKRKREKDERAAASQVPVAVPQSATPRRRPQKIQEKDAAATPQPQSSGGLSLRRRLNGHGEDADVEIISDSQRAPTVTAAVDDDVVGDAYCNNGITIAEDGVICIDDVDDIDQRREIITIDDDNDIQLLDDNLLNIDDEDAAVVQPPNDVIQLDDVDDARLPYRRPTNSNEPDFSGIHFTADDCSNAILQSNNSYASGNQISVFMAGFIPHYTFKTFNQIAFLDPQWQLRPRTRLTRFLRIHPRYPELILCPINLRNRFHWTLLSINVIQNTATYYDPLMSESDNPEFEGAHELYEKSICEHILKELQDAFLLCDGTVLIKASYNSFNQQSDTYSCGYFVMILGELIAKYGFTIKFSALDINEERRRINLSLHRLSFLNKHLRELNVNQVEIRTLPTWEEMPMRDAFNVDDSQIEIQSQHSQLPCDNTLVQKVVALPAVAAKPKQPLRKSQRIKRQRRKPDPAVIQSKIKSLQWHHKAIAGNDAELFPDEHYLGPMSKRCPYCKAYLFEAEDYSKCCANGTVPPPEVKEIPLEFENIRRYKEFMKNPRIYNSLFAMVSTCADIKMSDGIFKIQGEPRHNVGDLVPRPGQVEQFAQLYTIDGDDTVENRFRDLKKMGYKGKEADCAEVISLIEQMLRNHHPLVKELKTMKDKLADYEAECEREGKEMRRLFIVWEDPVLIGSGDMHPGRLNRPTLQNQVFSTFTSVDGGPPPRNGIYFGIEKNGRNNLREVPPYSGNLDAAAYPLIFVYGEPGWTPRIPKLNPILAAAQNGQSVLNKDSEQQLPTEAKEAPEQAETSTVEFNIQSNLDNNDGPEVEVVDDDDEKDIDVQSCTSDEDRQERRRPYVSRLMHGRAKLFDRTAKQKNDMNFVTGLGTLSQQYLIDLYLAVEQQRLDMLDQIADDNCLRYDDCKKLREALQNMMNKDPQLKGKKLGKVKLLTKKYRGGKPYMQHKFRNGIAITTRYGRDDGFITFTGNPTWREIQENLRPGEKWIDRPDLVCRVFNLKAAAFLKDLLKTGILGKVKAYKIALEHQKRGMPHLHCLITYHDEYKLDTPEKIDNIINAYLAPEPDEDDEHYEPKKRYYDYSMKYMIHDPSRCAAACGKGKKEGICSKSFPKPNVEITKVTKDGYAQLKRPDDGRTVLIKKNNRTTVSITNQWVVPHNRYLILKYNCHINVEHCGGSSALKYLHKYLHKGHDRAFISVREKVTVGKPNAAGHVEVDANGNPIETMDYNEIHQRRNLRIIGASEAVERMLGMFITKQSHAVVELPVHLPSEHAVYFKGSDDANIIARKAANDGTEDDDVAVSMLTGAMALVRQEAADPTIDQEDPTRAKNLYFHQFPEHYFWNINKKKFIRRQRVRNTIGRLQTVYPSNVERFCLRELLKDIKGPSCYEDLMKDKNGVSYETFRETAVARGLFVDDGTSKRLLEDIVSYAMPNECRKVFALLLIHNQPENPKELWDQFKEHMLDRNGKSLKERERRALAYIAAVLFHHNKSMKDLKMYNVTNEDLHFAINDTFSSIDTDGNERYGQLKTLQKQFVDVVFSSFDNPTNKSRERLFLLQSSGGCGKTYVFNTIIRTLIQNGYKVVAVASTGIAAILLDGGQTAHSAFHIPLDISKDANISATHPAAKLIREADCIIWDEAPMQHKSVLERAETLIKRLADRFDHHGNFATKTVILGGDFKQLLPVVKKEAIRASYEASILCSKVFRNNFSVYTLEENVRAESDPEYASWLNDVGNGVASSAFGKNAIQLPSEICYAYEQNAVDFVYPPYIFEYQWDRYLRSVKDVAILSPLNEKVQEINDILIGRLRGEAKTYTAVNTLPKTQHPGDEMLRDDYNSDVLDKYEHASIPPHKLSLKVGVVVMLTRNLSTNLGLCNGTRMVVRELRDRHVVCHVITGTAAGQNIPIFPIPNTFDDPDEDFPAFSRFQLPLRPAFAMTINKSQGQTLIKVGLLLDAQCFAHGQLYVALSRVRSRRDIRIYVPPEMWGVTDTGRKIPHAINIVFPEVIKTLNLLIQNSKRATVTLPAPDAQQVQPSQPQPSQQQQPPVQQQPPTEAVQQPQPVTQQQAQPSNPNLRRKGQSLRDFRLYGPERPPSPLPSQDRMF